MMKKTSGMSTVLSVFIVAFVFVFTSCSGGGGTGIQSPMQEADLIGLWEGTHFLTNRGGDGYDSTMTISRENGEMTVWFSNSGNAGFSIPIEGEIRDGQFILHKDSGNYTFAGTYTFTNDEKNQLAGEILRVHPDNSFYHWEGELNKYSSEYTGWARDVEYFRDTLPEKHINLFFKVTEETFNNACDDLIEIANTVSEAEVFLGLKEILAFIDDAHTNIHGFGSYQNTYYPFEFKKIGNAYYVVSVNESYADYLGSKLVALNGNGLEQIGNKVEAIIPAENDIMVNYKMPDYLNSPEALEYCNVVDTNSEAFVLEKNGNRQTVQPERLTKNQYNNNRVYLQWTPSIAEMHTDPNFWYEYLEKESILYFQYNRCSDHTDPELPKFAEVQQDLIDILENNNVAKFVADLRYNGGGNSTNGTNLARVLGELDVETEFYAIIGNQTFSSAIINSIDFHNYCDAILVGEPTSAKPNHYGEVKSFNLPNSKLRVQYSTKYFQLIDEEMDYLAPEYLVYKSFEDYINGVDSVLEYIRNMDQRISITKLSGTEGPVSTPENAFSWELVSQGSGLDRYEVKENDGNWIECTQTQYTWSGYAEGEHTLSVRAVDTNGGYSNELQWTFHYAAASDVILDDFAGTWEGTFTEVTDSTDIRPGFMTAEKEQVNELSIWLSCENNFSVPMSGSLEGHQLILIRQTDTWPFSGTLTFLTSEMECLTGNVVRKNTQTNNSDEWTCTLYKKKLFKGEGTDGYTQNTSLTFAWEFEDAHSTVDFFEFKKDDEDWEQISSSQYTWTGFSEGDHVFKVRAMTSKGDYSNEIVWEFQYVGDYESEGQFKIANSWGIGGNWENVPDGFYYITYEAMMVNGVWARLYLPRENHTPKALAVFEISHDIRSECGIFVGVGNANDPVMEKPVYDYYYKGGPFPFPENKIVVDITEFLPLQGERIYLKVVDSDETQTTGIVESFSVEIYPDAIDGEPENIYSSSDVPQNTLNNDAVVVYTEPVNTSIRSLKTPVQKAIARAATLPDRQMIDKLKDEIGVAEKDKDYNPLFFGKGTGWIPPSQEDWERIYQNRQMGLIDSFQLLSMRDEPLPASVDHSEEKWFPGIGDQGNKGSCVSFALGYYIATFYRARENDWDLSQSTWIGNAPPASFQSQIMSPDFLYHQLYYYRPEYNSDGGSNADMTIECLTNIGVSSWEKMPYDDQDIESWPSEAAWREAPFNRMDHERQSGNPLYYQLQIETKEDVEAVKQLLADGYLLYISIDAAQYKNLTEEDVWTIFNYDHSDGTNHANTIVGYRDH